jgi:hypothetical protein
LHSSLALNRRPLLPILQQIDEKLDANNKLEVLNASGIDVDAVELKAIVQGLNTTFRYAYVFFFSPYFFFLYFWLCGQSQAWNSSR